ncbi:MAG: hypothetical protein J6L69_00060 [Lachnospiraceae bacterium]|nr:hypothetical protein [Lachnospiraceae bacterium]
MKLKLTNIIMIIFFVMFHLILLKVVDYQDKRSFLFNISCYGISVVLICVLLIGIIVGISKGNSISYVKNMIIPLVSAGIVNYLYYETSIYLEKDIIEYTAMICEMLSFGIVLGFCFVKVIYLVKRERENDKRKTYLYFLGINVIILAVITLGGFYVLNYARGNIARDILLIMVFMIPTLSVLAIWSAIMWVLYRIKDRSVIL